MLIVKNKRYIQKHVVGGAGIFDTISSFFKRLESSNAARTVASNLSKAAASDIGKSAISAAKTVGKELATSAISTAKDLAIEKGKQLIDKASSKALTPKNVELIKKITGLEPKPVVTQKTKDLLADLINTGATTNINKLMMGQGINAIKIQDLVKGVPKLTQESKDLLATLFNNKPMMGQGMKQANAIRIQDLVKMSRPKGAGLRLA